MKEIKLTQGQVALVDDEGYEWLNSFKWYTGRCSHLLYAVRNISINGKQTTQRMHQLIMGDNPSKLDIDHRDGNGLNNQKSNLRFCTHQENQMNVRSHKDGSSKHRGVCWYKPSGKWIAQIQLNGKVIYLGLFDDEEDAARTYNTAAVKHFGEFAKPNLV